MAKALIILSGGQDSTTCLYWAKERFDELLALTFDYGQRHRYEIECAKAIALRAGVTHEVLNLGPLFAGLSPLTNDTQAVDTYSSPTALPGGLEKTFVPGRNILFLAVAANRAYVEGCEALVIGVAQEDFGGYPDCREEFILKMQVALESGLERPLNILTPLMHLTKRETVEMALGLPGCMDALGHSLTCYNGCVPPCGACHSCLLRARGFQEAGIDDPLLPKKPAPEDSRLCH
jgi:7-cyano-7-deazaguanine synthase